MKQLILCQTDMPEDEGFFSNYSPGIWWRNIYLSAEEMESSFWVTAFGGTFDDSESSTANITSFNIGTTDYTPRALSLLGQYVESFYFGFGDQDLFVTYSDKAPAYLFSGQSGRAYNFINAAQMTELGPTFSLYGEEYADPRLVDGSVDDTQEIDSIEDQRFIYDEWSFEVYNEDGGMDDLRSRIINREARILLAEVEDDETALEADFETIRYGKVSDVTYDDDRVMVSVEDPKSAYDQKINPNKLTQTEYPDMADSLVDKCKPMLLGRAIVPCLQLDDETFLVCDTAYGNMTAVHDVYVDDESESFTYSLADGTVTISGYSSGDVTADVTGIDESNVMEQILWLFDELANVPNTSDYFDTDQTAAMIAKGYSGAYYIDKSGIKLSEAIEELATGILTWIYPKSGGVFGVKDITPEDPIYDISFDEIELLPERSFDDDVYISTLTAQYAKDYVEDEYLSLYDNSKESEAIGNNRLDIDGEFETTVDNETDAQTLLTLFYGQRIESPEMLEMQFIEQLPFDLLDYVTYTHQRIYDPFGDDVKIITERSRYRVVEASRINKACMLRRIDSYPRSVLDTTILDFNGNPDRLYYLDFDGGDVIISFGEVG